ncbi:hypothetical protein ACTFIY_011464 [Dictyostelium cf. discoideum]
MNKVEEIAKQLIIKRVQKKGVRFYEISDPNKPKEEKLVYPSVSTVLSIIDQPGFKMNERDRLFSHLKKTFEKSIKVGVPMSKKQEYFFKRETLNKYDEISKNSIKYGSIIGTDSHNEIEGMVDEILVKSVSKSKPLKSLIETKNALLFDENNEIISQPLQPPIESADTELKSADTELKSEDIEKTKPKPKIKTKTELELSLGTSTISKELLLNDAPFKVKNVSTSFKDWEKLSGLKLEHNDTLVFSNKYKFAGACDAVARKPNGELVVLDWKTSSAMSINYALQISAYSKAIEEMTGEKISEAWVVKFNKSFPTFNTYSVKDIDSSFQNFLSALNLWNAYNIDKIDDSYESTEVHFFNHLPFASKFTISNTPTKIIAKKDNINDKNNNINNNNNNDDDNNDNNDNNDNSISFSKSGGIIIPDTIKKIKIK